ncbi:MAG: hypothetical protein ACMG6E_04505 [Candidatus Roizmanbacteria bacterium]
MIIASKIPYYLWTLGKLVLALKNPWVIIPIVLRKTRKLKFSNGLKFWLSQPLDLLIIAETILYDDYGFTSL